MTPFCSLINQQSKSLFFQRPLPLRSSHSGTNARQELAKYRAADVAYRKTFLSIATKYKNLLTLTFCQFYNEPLHAIFDAITAAVSRNISILFV